MKVKVAAAAVALSLVGSVWPAHGVAALAAAEPVAPSCIAPPNDIVAGFLLDQNGYRTIMAPDATTETAPFDVNNAGQIVGAYYGAGATVHGFRLPAVGGRFEVIDHPNAGTGSGLGTSLLKINSAGVIVGVYDDAANACHSFLRQPTGSFQDVQVFGAPTQALGLNDGNQITGGYVADGVIHGFVLTRGVPTTIDVPGAKATNATDINNGGQIVGVYSDDSGVHGFLLADGVVTPLDHPDAAGVTAPFGINNNGLVVGYYVDADQVRHGFAYSAGGFKTIDHPEAVDVTQAHGSNDAAAVVGAFGSSGKATQRLSLW